MKTSLSYNSVYGLNSLTKKRRNLKSFFKEYGMALAFFTPFGILFFLFTILPVISSIALSFTNYSVIQQPIFVGLKNYKYLITEDNIFIIAIKNTLTFAVFAGPIGYIASFVMAWIIDNLKLRKIFALAFYAPSITSGIAMSVIWLYFFSPDRFGFINYFLIRNGFITSPILWNQNPKYIMPIVILVSVWMSMGNGFLGFLAGFQNMPRDVYEAGAIDGISNKFQELIYIILPMMKPMLLFGAINTIVASFGVFDIAITIAGNPGPENAGLTIVGHLNDYAFTRFDVGYASSIAVVLFLLTFILGRVVFKILSTKD